MTEQLFVSPVRSRETDERYTPQWVFDALAIRFDLDPAAPVGGGDCVPALAKYTTTDDGLAQQWVGRVWVNPPFSGATAWADKFRQHSNGLFLGPVANARWWIDLVREADLVWHCRDFAFTHPTHAGKRTSMPLAFIAYGAECSTALQRLAASGVHDGVLVIPQVAA